MRHSTRLRHLIRLKLRRAHQARVGTQRSSSMVRSLDVGERDHVSGDSGREYGTSSRLRRCLRRRQADTDDADEHRQAETVSLACHTAKRCNRCACAKRPCTLPIPNGNSDLDHVPADDFEAGIRKLEDPGPKSRVQVRAWLMVAHRVATLGASLTGVLPSF